MKKGKVQNIIINGIYVLTMIVVVAPLLILGKYNYPSADDWSFGAATHKVIVQGGNIFDVLKEAFNVAMLWREKGEPRYANAFLGALQPGIWGEEFYCITPWIMIGSIIVAELMLCHYFLCSTEEQNQKWVLPVVVPTVLIQLLCVPYPVETFYWYTGAVNYTFIYSLSLVLLIIFLKLKNGNLGKVKMALYLIGGCFIAVIVGGDSYAASLSAVCVFWSFTLWGMWKDKKAVCRTLPITVITTVGLLICLIAPGNMVRLNQEFGGTTTGPFYAIFMSLVRTGVNIFSWTDGKILLMMLLMFPFLWIALGKVRYSFKYPVFFTIFSFGIYSSQIVATMYVDGTTGGCRMADVLYYAYHVWIVLNLGYWIGWMQSKFHGKAILVKVEAFLRKRNLIWRLCVGIMLLAVLLFTEIKYTSTYRASVWLIKGYAEEYEKAWQERLAVLKDPGIKEVYFDPLPGYGEMVFYADFQQGENWVNNACEVYYEKDYIGLK